MQSLRNCRLARGALVALSFCLMAHGALAEPVPWDQKTVTAIAEKLAQELRGLSVTVRRSPQLPTGSSGRRAQFQARENVRLLVWVSARLASQLQAGDDKDATLPTYRRLQMTRRDAEQSARRIDIPTATLERIVKAQDLVDQLSPFYEDPPGTPAPAE